jgi:hypothetical protein
MTCAGVVSTDDREQRNGPPVEGGVFFPGFVGPERGAKELNRKALLAG